MFIFDNVVDSGTLQSYRDRIKTHFESNTKSKLEELTWEDRDIILDQNDPIIETVKSYIESKIKVELTCIRAELSTWPIGSESLPHIHDSHPLSDQIDYNSILYLNEDFAGGVFTTAHGVIVIPKENRLTFFDGSKIYHGLTEVSEGNRYSIMFWWGNTKF